MTITDLIQAAAQKYGVDASLALAVAQQESGLDPNAYNPNSKATGVMQLIPSTAAGLGVDPNDVSQNIDGGVKYLGQLLNQFGGNVSLALAAYNAGPGTVQRYGGIPPFSETQNYVASILSKLGIGSSPPADPIRHPPTTARAGDSTTPRKPQRA